MKKLINIISGDAERQCKKDPACHRFDGHESECKTFAVVVAEKLEAGVRDFFKRVRGAS